MLLCPFAWRVTVNNLIALVMKHRTYGLARTQTHAKNIPGNQRKIRDKYVSEHKEYFQVQKKQHWYQNKNVYITATCHMFEN
jgi:hypothetical protein